MNFKRHFVVTGARGAFGSALVDALKARGASVETLQFGKDWDYVSLNNATEALKRADVLVLSHGSKLKHAMEANCTSFVEFIETYRKLRKDAGLAAEVWGLGSEIEFHPAWGNKELQVYLESKRAFAKKAAAYYRESDGERWTYRHIVPAGFTSRMGPGLISGRTAVKIALFFLERDWKYIPVTYTGFAFLNYFRFKRLQEG